MVAQVNTARFLTQPHQHYNQNIEQPSLRTVKNRVEWKSDKYRIQETTSIQTGKTIYPGGAETQNGLVPHPCVVDKN